jgi:hypothetical protein
MFMSGTGVSFTLSSWKSANTLKTPDAAAADWTVWSPLLELSLGVPLPRISFSILYK